MFQLNLLHNWRLKQIRFGEIFPEAPLTLISDQIPMNSLRLLAFSSFHVILYMISNMTEPSEDAREVYYFMQ